MFKMHAACMLFQSQLSFLPTKVGKSSMACLVGLRRCTFTCVGWQLTLCDPIWQVGLRSSAMDFLLIHQLYYWTIFSAV